MKRGAGVGFALVASVLGVLGACSGQKTAGCVAGATQACLGDGRCAGVQICESTGSGWGACDCGDASTIGAIQPGALLVDDESSSIGQISLANGGTWGSFATATTSGAVKPVPGEPFFFTDVNGGAISRAACVSASDVTASFVGEDFAFQARDANGGLVPYDASAYSGVSFYAMSPDLPEALLFFQDTNTERFWPGATCAGGADAGPLPQGGYPDPPCQNGPAATIALNTGWKQYSIPFSSLSAFPGNGYYVPPSLDTQGLLSMGFQIDNPNRNNDAGPPLSFELCVAEIYFTQ